MLLLLKFLSDLTLYEDIAYHEDSIYFSTGHFIKKILAPLNF